MVNLADVSIDTITGNYVLRTGKITTNSYKYLLNDPIERYCRNRQGNMYIEFTHETVYKTKDELESELVNMDYGDIYIFTCIVQKREEFTAFFGVDEFIDKVLKDF